MNARGQGRGRWKGQRSRGRSCYSHYGSRGRGHTRGGLNSVNNLIPSPLSQLCQSRIEVVSPYQGWKLYFPDEAYSEQSSTVGRVKTFQKFFFNSGKHYDLNEIEMAGYFIVSFKEMVTHEIILDEVPNLLAELQDMPEKIIACLGLAMHQILTKQRKNGEDAELATEVGAGQFESGTYSIPIVHARIIDYNTIVPLKHIKANYYGKCVSVKGTVVRVSNVKPFCLKMGFECNSCETLQTLLLSDGKYAMPTKCSNRECRSKAFIPRRNSSFTETVDWQTIRVQELIGDDQKESGRIPRTIDCELSCDLANSCLFGFFAQVPLPPPKDLKIKVDSCVPGDIVTVVGIVKVNSSEEGRGRNKDKCLFLLYIQANSVSNSKGSKCSSGDPGYGMAMDFTMKELYAIQEIQSEKNLFRLLVGSLCSSIYGHEMVKAGLLLGLFGGTQKFGNDKNRIPVRGDPHVLVVGDPGLGKSQMLQSVANVAPRSVYVCGNTTTTSGLTVTLSKDGGSNDHALEAGALVLADQGCCCIDEFDKMGNQHQALLEAMEQQSISIAKAGIVCSLPARSSIIAAANPVGGHYNKSKTVSENLKMGGALLSRFDLVFILLDKPDEEMDSMLSEYVMALHAGKQKALTGVCVRRHNQTKSQDTDESRLQWEMDKPLSEKLKILRGEQMDLIPSQLLRKYVGYARKYVHPHIGLEAAKVLQNFYLDLRRRHQTQDSTPITTRQLESLIRLTEARARLELREEATQTDAEDVIEIMRYSMRETYSDQFGLLDFQRSQHGSGMSGRSKPKKFISALQRISNQTYNSLFTISQMRQIAKDIGLQTLDFEGFISSLNNQGFLLKRGPKVYQLQTTDY